MHGDLGNVGLDDAAVEAAVELARFDRCAVAGGKHQVVVKPSILCLIAVGLLLLLAQLELLDIPSAAR